MKRRVILLFGGKSTEHEVSLASALSVYKVLDKNKYDVHLINISKEGEWITGTQAKNILEQQEPLQLINSSLPETSYSLRKDVMLPSISSVSTVLNEETVVFPILHGKYGEDGTIQGMLELANIPYVGCNVLSSALGMDKVKQKEILSCYGIPIVKYVYFKKSEWLKNNDQIISDIFKKLGKKFPLFIKPANSGSSVGITKAHNKQELLDGINQAVCLDTKILVEKGIDRAREIEVSVLGNDEAKASVCGEIIPSNEFYDYDAKYCSGKSKIKIPAGIPNKLSIKIRKIAVDTYRALDCAGMSRVDFLVDRKTNKVYLNEINTIPGFTSISMYPKLWEATGISYSQLINQLIELAVSSWKERQKLKTNYKGV